MIAASTVFVTAKWRLGRPVMREIVVDVVRLLMQGQAEAMLR